jgi:hypothetical protein
MLAFIVPFKSVQVAGSWDSACRLLERTLRSICRQTNTDYIIIVICHEIPDICFIHPAIFYVQRTTAVSGVDYLSKEHDKMCKMLLGVRCAHDHAAAQVMFVDADDCVSRQIAEFARMNTECNGFYFRSGYEYQEDRKILKFRRKGFHLRTNTSHIIRLDLLNADMMMKDEDVRCRGCVFYHVETAQILRLRGTALMPLPFCGSIYMTDNGENIWWSRAKIREDLKNRNLLDRLRFGAGRANELIIRRRLTDDIRLEFGLPRVALRRGQDTGSV